jgi:methyl-accepting chemotaxis protein
MFKNLHLWTSLTVGMGLVILLAVAGVSWGMLTQMRSLVSDAERAELAQLAETVRVRVSAETRLAEAMSALVANIPEVQSRFAVGDRAWLQATLLPAYRVLEKDYGAVQFQFHTPPARSFLRLHKIEKFGDDLSSFRHSVVDANTDRLPQRGLESGVAGLGARGVVPVFDQERHLGTVEFGMSFGQPFFTAFREAYGVDAGLYLPREDGFETFAGTLGEGSVLSDEELRTAFAGEPVLAETSHAGRSVAVYAFMISDYSDTPLGVVELVKDRWHYAGVLRDATRRALLIGGVALLVGLSIALYLARDLSRRIQTVVAGVARISEGDLTGDMSAEGRNEMAALARAADGMRRGLNELVTEVESGSGAVNRAAGEIARAVDSQAATSSEMSASVAEITSTMEEFASSSTQIAESSSAVVEVARNTLEQSREGAQAMQQLQAQMQSIRAEDELALKEIMDLGSKSKEITRIREIIDTVADQTKLIAFNAALEASSAGEAGKRFGVVAAEIRRLADSVTESTAEIEKRTSEIQASISRLVMTSEKGSAGIQQGMEACSRTTDLLNGLVQGADDTTGAAQQISLSSQQQKTASEQVVVALREIVGASSETADSVRRIADISREMTGLSASLTESVSHFKLARPGEHAETDEAAATGANPGPGA